MDCVRQPDAGGIAGLLTLLREHREAVEYDLIRVGLRLDDLGTPRLSWRDLHVVVSQTIKLERPESAIVRAAVGPAADWSLEAYLLAGIYDGIAWLVWAKTEGAAEGKSSPPEPLPRPGAVKGEEGPKLSMDEVKAWLAGRNPQQHEHGG